MAGINDWRNPSSTTALGETDYINQQLQQGLLTGPGGAVVGGNFEIADTMAMAKNQLYTLTGIDPLRSQGFGVPFDSLAGWVDEGTSAAGQSAAFAFVTSTEYDNGQATVQLNAAGPNSIMRGWFTNPGGVFAFQIPRTAMLDQITPLGMAVKFQIPTDSGSYMLAGFSDPTSSGLVTSPAGVYVGFAHSQFAFNYLGFKYNGVGIDQTVSTVPLDGGWHIGYVWCDPIAQVYKARIDNEAPLTLPNVNTFNNVKACARIAIASTQPRVAWCAAIWPGVG